MCDVLLFPGVTRPPPPMPEEPLEEFEVGDYVRLSERGRWLHPRSARTGRVERLCNDSSCIAVRRDGVNQAQIYHKHFWTKDSPPVGRRFRGEDYGE